MESDGEFIDIELRPAEEVARRCIILASLLQLAAIDAGQSGSSGDDLETTSFDHREWLRSQDLWGDLSQAETKAFLRSSSKGPAAAPLDPLGLGESLGALGWALGAVQDVAPLQRSHIEQFTREIPEPWESPQTWVESQRLRPETEIAAQREAAELWTWRLEAELERRDAPSVDRREFDASLSAVMREAIAAGLLPDNSSRNDLAIWDAVDKRDSAEIAILRALEEQRLKALNWLCGFGATWDDVPLDI